MFRGFNCFLRQKLKSDIDQENLGLPGFEPGSSGFFLIILNVIFPDKLEPPILPG
jgi:hypothetical protein